MNREILLNLKKPVNFAEAGLELQNLTLLEKEIYYGVLTIIDQNNEFSSDLLKDTDVLVGTVVGFPHGTTTTEVKVFETKQAVTDGATEIDMVINIGHLKSGMNAEVQADIKAVVDASGGHTVKVILENAYLTDEEKVTACKLSEAAGAHYVKTSTGYAPTGASIADIKLMKASVSPHIKIKSAGGVRTLDSLMEYLDAGISRSGATTTAVMIDEFIERFGRE